MSNIIVSGEKIEIIKSLKNIGYNVISSKDLSVLHPFERRHADIQCLKIQDTYFVLKECKSLISVLKKGGKKVVITEKNIGKEYPENVLLNAVYIGNKLYCKKDALDNSVKKYCTEHSIDIINVNQGYTKCSTAVFKDCFITSDTGIFNSIAKSGVEGLLINSGDIDLKGVDYGFIGGCCFYDNNTAYFTGDLNKHTDGKKIISFLNKRNLSIEFLSDSKLYDIGGFIIY